MHAFKPFTTPVKVLRKLEQYININQFCLFQALSALLEDDSKFGFIVMDGKEALFGTLCGNSREVLNKIRVDLPKKHGKHSLLTCICISFVYATC